MSHHSSDMPLIPEMAKEAFKKSDQNAAKRQLQSILQQAEGVSARPKLGPTGDHPDGKIVPHDEGGLIFGITVFNGCVVMDFGKPIQSIGFTRDQAEDIAALLLERARQCPPIIGKTKTAE